MDYNARFYSPRLMRFTQPDTIVPGMSSQAYNRYSYVNNNPIMMIDPSGHIAEGECSYAANGCSTETTCGYYNNYCKGKGTGGNGGSKGGSQYKHATDSIEEDINSSSNRSSSYAPTSSNIGDPDLNGTSIEGLSGIGWRADISGWGPSGGFDGNIDLICLWTSFECDVVFGISVEAGVGGGGDLTTGPLLIFNTESVDQYTGWSTAVGSDIPLAPLGIPFVIEADTSMGLPSKEAVNAPGPLTSSSIPNTLYLGVGPGVSGGGYATGGWSFSLGQIIRALKSGFNK